MLGDLPPSSSETFLQVAGRGLDDQLADFGRAGEGHLVDVGMGGDGRASGFAETGDNVDDAVREADLGDELAQSQRGQRRLLGRLEDAGAANGERRCQLP